MSEDIVEKLRAVDTPTLSNAVELLQVRNRMSGFCSRAMRQLTPELGTVCGYAVTVHATSATPEPCERKQGVERYLDVCRALQTSPKPAVVVIQEFGPHPEYATHIGDVLGTLFGRFGAVGVVSDGAVRDLPELRAMGFQAFAPGSVASHGNLAVLRVQEPVVVCGLTVNPGDLLHGDEHGLITVPEEGRDRLPALADQVRAKERALQDYLNSGEVDLETIRERMTH